MNGTPAGSADQVLDGFLGEGLRAAPRRATQHSDPASPRRSFPAGPNGADTAYSLPRQTVRPRERASSFARLLFFGDSIVAFVAVSIGFALRTFQRGEWLDFTRALFSGERQAVLWVLGGSLLFPWLMTIQKSYEVSNVYRMHLWAKNLIKTSILWPIVMFAIIGVTRDTSLTPRLGFVYAAGALLGCQFLWRLAIYTYLIQPRVREVASSRVLVVGWNHKAAAMRLAMRRDASLLGEIVGCIPTPGGRLAEPPPRDVPILGDYEELPQLVRSCDVHSIILADVGCPASEIQALIEYCQREYIEFRLVPLYFPALSSKLQVKTVAGVPLLGIVDLPLDLTTNRILKRCLDIVGGIVGLALSAPVIAIFGLLVWLEQHGPILYRQTRTSQSGRTFTIYKIRSMRINAEAGTGAVWCRRDDPRRLRVGAFMRRWNIDELPQFWNVIIGDMSLVGPRPERPELIEQFKSEIANYNVRHYVRAGLTGYAQVHGYRGDSDLRKRIEMDLYYLENWSLMLDLYCIAATFFRFKNAH